MELLIYAHDCHTVACSMEGIAAVLRAAQSLVDALQTAEEYNLMVSERRFLQPVYTFQDQQVPSFVFDHCHFT